MFGKSIRSYIDVDFGYTAISETDLFYVVEGTVPPSLICDLRFQLWFSLRDLMHVKMYVYR